MSAVGPPVMMRLAAARQPSVLQRGRRPAAVVRWGRGRRYHHQSWVSRIPVEECTPSSSSSSSSLLQQQQQQRHGGAWSGHHAGGFHRSVSQQQRRSLSSTPVAQHGHLTPPTPGEERTVTIVDQHGARHAFQVADGDNLLDVAQAGDLEMEGACGGSCACSTCHVIVEDPAYYDKMDEPDDDENDMLDLAFGLTETSRLGCQIRMSKDLDGLVVRLPSMTRNLQKSDFESR